MGKARKESICPGAMNGTMLSRSWERLYLPRHRLLPVSGSDLTSLNSNRLILDSVGPELLADIVGDVQDLLGTSCAVHEKNGDYALSYCGSGWCRFWAQSSRKLCAAADDRQALASGQWHCHESSWNEAARRAMASGLPTDGECRGGIRLFAVPIRAGEETETGQSGARQTRSADAGSSEVRESRGAGRRHRP